MRQKNELKRMNITTTEGPDVLELMGMPE
jgi:hypothetical protein